MVYTREQVKKLIDDYREEFRRINGEKMTLQNWCNVNRLYYSGVVRFLKGADINSDFYFRILEAADPDSFKPLRHYLAQKITFNDLRDLKSFCKEAMVI